MGSDSAQRQESDGGQGKQASGVVRALHRQSRPLGIILVDITICIIAACALAWLPGRSYQLYLSGTAVYLDLYQVLVQQQHPSLAEAIEYLIPLWPS